MEALESDASLPVHLYLTLARGEVLMKGNGWRVKVLHSGAPLAHYGNITNKEKRSEPTT